MCTYIYYCWTWGLLESKRGFFLLVCIKINSYDLFLLLLKNLTMCVHKDIQPNLKQKTQLFIFMWSQEDVNMFSVNIKFFGKAVNDFEDKIFIEDCNKAASEVTHYVVFQTVFWLSGIKWMYLYSLFYIFRYVISNI